MRVGNGGQRKKRLVGQERMKNQFPKGNMTGLEHGSHRHYFTALRDVND